MVNCEICRRKITVLITNIKCLKHEFLFKIFLTFYKLKKVKSKTVSKSSKIPNLFLYSLKENSIFLKIYAFIFQQFACLISV